ncbi:MAG: phenylalanine--tRNA ligase beta subunit-related protein, partial [Nocardioidaceae bacterium]
MKISREWLSDYVTLPAELTPEQLSHDLTLKTVEVEHVVDTSDDLVLEIDNKSLTNRPDLWGHIGIARELATIYQRPLSALESAVPPATVDGLVEIDDAERCRRFAAVSFDMPRRVETPAWMARRLKQVGEYVGLFLVDLSNYVMLATGQPNHVYDRDLVSLPLTVVAGGNEPLELLSGAKVDVRALSVIRDADRAVGLAGVMGALDSGVGPGTLRAVLE